MQVELELLGELIADFHGVVAGPFAAGLTQAAGGGAHGGTGAADVPTLGGQFLKAGFQFFGAGAQEDEVAGGAVHVQNAAAVLVPDVAQLAEGRGGVVPAGGLVDPHGVEMFQTGELIREVGVTADDAGAVSQDADDAAVLPVGDLLFVRPFQLRPAGH